MIFVTGGAGFIGSNLVQALNERGRDDIVVVDDLTDGAKFRNISDARIADYIDQEAFPDWLSDCGAQGVEAIFHLGACSDTTEWDGRFMMDNNYAYSKTLLHTCIHHQIPFIYASSAAVYGGGTNFSVRINHERPLNVYGYSKALFDQYVARQLPRVNSQVLGLRYFNVYGPREQHKGSMASVAFHHYRQIQKDGVVRLFEGCDGYADGEQLRDFIHVDDAVAVNLWALDHPAVSGVFNCGTGKAEPFNTVAEGVVNHFGFGDIQYIPFPGHLRGRYQSYTQADISDLRSAGYSARFLSVAEGVSRYMQWLEGEVNAPSL